MAAGFLRESALKHGKAKADLDCAASCFEVEAEVLGKGRDLLFWSSNVLDDTPNTPVSEVVS